MRGTEMHHSRLCAVLIDCKTSDVDQAARFWGEALGLAVDPNHPNSRGNYRMLEIPPDELIVEIQRVDHESRVHIDIETDDIPAEVARLEKLGANVVDRLTRWVVMQAPTGQRFCIVRLQRPGLAHLKEISYRRNLTVLQGMECPFIAWRQEAPSWALFQACCWHGKKT